VLGREGNLSSSTKKKDKVRLTVRALRILVGGMVGGVASECGLKDFSTKEQRTCNASPWLKFFTSLEIAILSSAFFVSSISLPF